MYFVEHRSLPSSSISVLLRRGTTETTLTLSNSIPPFGLSPLFTSPFAIFMSNTTTTAIKRRKDGTKTTVPAAATTTGKRKRPAKPKNPSKDSAEMGVGDIEDLLKFNAEEIVEIRASLLKWYDENQRDLPWRRLASIVDEEDDGGERRAYGVWVSEVMLQQTRVTTVIDYYNRWMQKWSSVHHLSRASLEEVNEIWAGLGYYRRARYLLEGAKEIVEEGGRFPRTVSTLRKIRGIGNYTAGAIASIAFKEPVPVVDGNVVRVLARLKAISANPKNSVTVKKFWGLAGQLVDSCRPGDFNQALMELGATICTPTSPSCSNCPISIQCHALSLSQHDSLTQVTDFPQKAIKAKQRNEFSAVCVVEISETKDSLERDQGNSQYLLVKRPDEGLLAGLWEFPSILMAQESGMAIRRKAMDDFLRESFNIDTKKTCRVVSRDDVGEYIHVFSHIRLKMYVELLIIHLKGGLNHLQSLPAEGNIQWKCVDSKELSRMGLTSGVRKVYTMIKKFKQKSLLTAIEDTKSTRVRKRR